MSENGPLERERKLLRDVFKGASERVAKWPEWRRSFAVREQLEALKMADKTANESTAPPTGPCAWCNGSGVAWDGSMGGPHTKCRACRGTGLEPKTEKPAFSTTTRDQLRGAVSYLEGHDAEHGTGPGREAAWATVDAAATALDQREARVCELEQAAQAEREACARICDEAASLHRTVTLPDAAYRADEAEMLAFKIRDRGRR